MILSYNFSQNVRNQKFICNYMHLFTLPIFLKVDVLNLHDSSTNKKNLILLKISTFGRQNFIFVLFLSIRLSDLEICSVLRKTKF